jgi:SAM-dependent methyltransferase
MPAASLRTFLGRIRRRLFWARLQLRNQGRSGADIFKRYWADNHWRNRETRSGDGSTIAYTEPLRRELPPLLARLGARTMLDLPCGDFHWIRHMPLPGGLRYVGADIVPGMIAELQRRHAGALRSFLCIDALTDDLPEADLWLCRDLVIHLPNADVLALLARFARSRIRYLLVTSHAATVGANTDTFMGGFQLVNLQLPPFALPEPDECLRDWVAGYPERWMLLYRREVIESWWRARA